VDADRAEAKGKGDEQPVAHQDPGQEAVPRQPAQAAEGLEPPKPKGGSQSVATRDALREGFGPAALGRDPFDNVKTMGRRDASDDSLPRVGAGEDESALNAMPYRYIGFFERVKDAVRREWDPNAAYGPRDPTGAAFGYKDRMTVLKVVLDRRGKLLDAVVVSSCGLGFLDDEAKRAMWAASPYANPPEGLVGDDGRIKFEFGFVFLLSSARHKLFWRLQ
jgi:TonB family protein